MGVGGLWAVSLVFAGPSSPPLLDISGSPRFSAVLLSLALMSGGQQSQPQPEVPWRVFLGSRDGVTSPWGGPGS